MQLHSPVSNDVVKLTNVQWTINGRELERELSIAKVVIINDFAGIGYGLLGLKEYDYIQMNPGVKPHPTGQYICCAMFIMILYCRMKITPIAHLTSVYIYMYIWCQSVIDVNRS
jgi:hypothetical protein